MSNIVANIGILSFVVYTLFKVDTGFPAIDMSSPKKKIAYIFFEIIIGSLILQFPISIAGMQYDFRFLLYALSIKYLGWQVTMPSTFILTLLNLYWHNGVPPWLIIAQGIVMTAMLPMLMHMIRHKLSDFQQLVWLVLFATFVSIVSAIYLIPRTRDVAIVFFVMGTVAYGMISLLYFIIYDLKLVKHLIHQDPLTKVHNKRKFEEDLVSAYNHYAHRSVALFDIDYFKGFNDDFGHDVGDEILRVVAQKVLIRFYDSNCSVYRIGGDEFAIIVVNREPDEIEALMTLLVYDMRERLITVPGQRTVRVTLSVGVAHAQPKEFMQHTVKRADVALYRAKEAGRNTMRVSRMEEAEM